MNVVWRFMVWLLALGLLALPVVAVLNGWVGAERWPLSRLRVTGQFEHVQAAQVQAAMLPYASQGFFAISLGEAKAAVESLPWVNSAKVSKQWPDVLEVEVIEHKVFARWGNGQLLSTQGEVFAVPVNMENIALPLLNAPDAKVDDMVQLYNYALNLFDQQGMKVVEVTMDPRGSWSLKLDCGIYVVMGRDDALSRLKRFAHVLPQLIHSSGLPLERADLRYTNGFTLRWADAATQAHRQGAL